jgi:S1-C subfamily serine protease
MAIRIGCPSCKAACVVEDAMRGRQIVCQHCQKPMQIPAATAIKAGLAKQGPVVVPQVGVRSKDMASRQPVPQTATKRASRLPVVLYVGGGVAAISMLAAIGFAVLWLLSSHATVTATNPHAVVDASKANPQGEPAATKTPEDNSKTNKNTSTPNAPDDKAVPAPGGGQLTRQVLARVKEATVHIRVTLSDGTIAQGSGFFGIEPGLVLTNAHVVGMLNADTPPPRMVEIIYLSGEPNSRKFTGKILGVDRSSDLALLRVTGTDLPAPLEVKTTTDLIETQTVYVVGFPFGEFLGKNITVSQSSVSSLRKGADGGVVKVQVNGGMQPGNSGGPVVNTSGEVVGVAVSIIQATQINFAVPGEYVHIVSNGRIAGISNGLTVRDGGKVKMPIHLDVLDPLGRVRKVWCDWWTASDGTSRPATSKQPEALPGDTKHQRLEMPYSAGASNADLIVPANIPAGHVIWVQPVVVNGSGETKWAAPVKFIPSAPVDKEPALLVLKHYWGARPLVLSSSAKIKLISAAAPEIDFVMNTKATMTETMVNQRESLADLRMRYLKYEVGLPTELMTPQNDAQIKRAIQMIGAVHADLTVDDKNNLKKNTVEVNVKEQPLRKELTDLHGQLQQSLEMLSVPLPGHTVKPGETWKAKRPLTVFTGQPGDKSTMDVTYTFQGVRQQNGHSEGVITMVGQAKGRPAAVGFSVSGRVTGTAYLDLAAYQVSSAVVDAKVNMGDSKGKMMEVELESKVERTLGNEVLRLRDKLTDNEPLDANNRPFKVHTVQLEAGRPCVISLESPKGPGYFDTFLRVEDNAGKMLAENDDSGVDMNSMVVFTPQETGTYRIVAKSFFAPGAEGLLTPTGNYLLVVRQ